MPQPEEIDPNVKTRLVTWTRDVHTGRLLRLPRPIRGLLGMDIGTCNDHGRLCSSVLGLLARRVHPQGSVDSRQRADTRPTDDRPPLQSEDLLQPGAYGTGGSRREHKESASGGVPQGARDDTGQHHQEWWNAAVQEVSA